MKYAGNQEADSRGTQDHVLHEYFPPKKSEFSCGLELQKVISKE